MALGGITQIISGGQVGADRAGLDFALATGMACGGWCPAGRRAEDGAIPAKYPLREMSSASYAQRTEQNVQDSDGTIVFTTPTPGRGSAYTVRCCIQLDKPYEVLKPDVGVTTAALKLLAFVGANGIKILNVAGSRQPEFYHWTLAVLRQAAVAAQEQEQQGGEDPKKFLREVCRGIGESQASTQAEWIDFQDDQGVGCKVQCYSNERLWVIPGSGRLALSPGQAKRLANTLERWASAGNLGKGFEVGS